VRGKAIENKRQESNSKAAREDGKTFLEVRGGAEDRKPEIIKG